MSPRESLASGPLDVVELSNRLCRHELALGTCAICRHDKRRSVYITGGGGRYHARSDCPALLEGQRQVEARGGTTDRIEGVHPGSARLEGRVPCRACKPA